MSLRVRDEDLHHPPVPLPTNWQENLFFILWNTDTRDGLMMHVQRVPGRGVQEARIVVCAGGESASATLTGPYRIDALVDGIEVDISEPFREISLQATFHGSRDPGPLGFIAAFPSGDVPVVVDIGLSSTLEPVDFADGLATLVERLRADASSPQMGDQAHYEQGGTWSGRIRVGDREVRGAGLFVRDHSWGVRHEHNDFRAFWTATCLADGNVFCNAIGMPTTNGTVGIGAVSDRRGVRFTTQVAATFSPLPGLCTYETSEVVYGPEVNLVVHGTTQQHWPLYLPYSGHGRFDNNAISSARAGDLHGFSVMEWATTLSSDQVVVLDRAAEPLG